MNKMKDTEKERKAVQKIIDKKEKELRKLYTIQRKLVYSLDTFTKTETDTIKTILQKDIDSKK
jgi:hypothetical protein